MKGKGNTEKWTTISTKSYKLAGEWCRVTAECQSGACFFVRSQSVSVLSLHDNEQAVFRHKLSDFLALTTEMISVCSGHKQSNG